MAGPTRAPLDAWSNASEVSGPPGWQEMTGVSEDTSAPLLKTARHASMVRRCDPLRQGTIDRHGFSTCMERPPSGQQAHCPAHVRAL